MMKAVHMVVAAVCAALFLPALAQAQAQVQDMGEKPRLVSLDYCADQFALALADPDQIAGLSPDADAVHSFFADRAAGLPKFSGSTEEVLKLRPDLVLRTWKGDQRSRTLFRALEMTVASTAFGSDPEIIFGNLEMMGHAMGQAELTEELLALYRARLAALEASPPTKLRAAYVTSSGFSAGKGTFVNSVIQLAGFEAVSSELGLEGWVSMPLESFIMDPPDLIIGSFFDLEDQPDANWSIVRHPLFAEIMKDIPTIMVPGRYLSCNGFFFIDAAEYIRDQAAALGLISPELAGAQP